MIAYIESITKRAWQLVTAKIKHWKWVLVVYTLILIVSIVVHAPGWADNLWWLGIKPRLLTAMAAALVWFVCDTICARRQDKEISTPVLGCILLIFGAFTFCDIERIQANIPNPELTLYSAAIFLLSWAVFRWASLLFWVPFLLLEVIQAVSFHTMGFGFSAGVVSEIVHASKEEIAHFLTYQNATLLIVLLLTILLISYAACRYLRRYSSLRLCSAAAFLLLIFALCGLTIPYNSRISSRTWLYHDAISFVSNVENGVKRNIRLIKKISILPSPAAAPSSIPTVPQNGNIVFILHIGESVRANHLPFNGYHRNTAPWLSEQPRLINFPRCIAAACDTCDAVATILTDATASIAYTNEEPATQPTVKAVSDIFYANGFYVSYHVGYKHLGFAKNTVTAAFQSTFSQLIYLFSEKSHNLQESPGSVMAQTTQVLDVCRNNPEKNLFFVINNEGSHGPFQHFDHEHPAFAPYDDNSLYSTGKGKPEHIINAYDNTIVHTDSYIRTIIEGLGNRPYVYLYVSDHGESLGYDSNGNMGRGWITGQPNAEAYLNTFLSNDICIVPMFILTSPELEQLHPHFTKALNQLKNNTHLTTGHGHVFHTILGLFNAQTPHYREEWDLCSDKVKPYRGNRPVSVKEAERK